VTVIDGAPRLLGECAERWPKLSRVVIVESEREVGGKRTRATRWYITSLAEEAGEMSRIVRGHWGIENRLHWVLDVAFGDDRSRVREANAAANFTILRQMAHTLLTKETSTGRGVKTRRLCAGWDNAYLLKVLGM
jgi:predicted transposase YbfD/YdcC